MSLVGLIGPESKEVLKNLTMKGACQKDTEAFRAPYG